MADPDRANAADDMAGTDGTGEGDDAIGAKWAEVALGGGDMCDGELLAPVRGGSSIRIVDLFGTTTSLLVGVGMEPVPVPPSGTGGGKVAFAGAGLELPVEVGVGARR